MFKAVSAKVDIQKLERDQLNFWREKSVFARTTEGRENAPRYVFYEGPPTANGKPGTHHVLARAFKDMFPRYKVMRGYYCLRTGGWDTHGLPVEIEVEKELGLKHKHEVEEYGIAAFNEKCRCKCLALPVRLGEVHRAHWFLGRPRQCLHHLQQRLYPERLVDSEAALGQGIALSGL